MLTLFLCIFNATDRCKKYASFSKFARALINNYSRSFIEHLQKYSYHRKHGFLPSLHCGFTAPDAVAYMGVGDSVQARKLVKLSRAPIVFV